MTTIAIDPGMRDHHTRVFAASERRRDAGWQFVVHCDKSTLRAMLTALEAAKAHDNTVAALSQMIPESARADGMYRRVTDTSFTLRAALAPLFPKEYTEGPTVNGELCPFDEYSEDDAMKGGPEPPVARNVTKRNANGA